MADLPDETVSWKAEWLQALRSGQYVQGSGTLRKGDCFCCLGVLCDIVDPANWDSPLPSGTYCVKVHDGDDLLPGHIAQIAGVNRETQWELANLNDRGKTFVEIADYIEAHL